MSDQNQGAGRHFTYDQLPGRVVFGAGRVARAARIHVGACRRWSGNPPGEQIGETDAGQL